jgi:hypothetical protein
MTPGAEFVKELRTHIAVGSEEQDSMGCETHAAMECGFGSRCLGRWIEELEGVDQLRPASSRTDSR